MSCSGCTHIQLANLPSYSQPASQVSPCFCCAYRYAAPVYCDIKHLVMVTEEDGAKVEESSVKHEKIFLGEVHPERTVYFCVTDMH